MQKPSRSQRVVVTLIVVIAGFHLLSVTTAAIPTNQTSTAMRPVTSYLDPFFTQNWRLFAPNPISSDRSLGFRGEYTDSGGRTRTTKWLDWSDIELDLVHHEVVGGRAGYITNKMIGPLNNRFLAMTLAQRKIALEDKQTALAGYAALRAKLVAQNDNPRVVTLFLRYEASAVRLATEALQAAHPDVSFTAVRYRIVTHDVVPYAARTAGSAARPAPVIRRSGWRKPIQGTRAERDVFADFYRRHR